MLPHRDSAASTRERAVPANQVVLAMPMSWATWNATRPHTQVASGMRTTECARLARARVYRSIYTSHGCPRVAYSPANNAPGGGQAAEGVKESAAIQDSEEGSCGHKPYCSCSRFVPRAWQNEGSANA